MLELKGNIRAKAASEHIGSAAAPKPVVAADPVLFCEDYVVVSAPHDYVSPRGSDNEVPLICPDLRSLPPAHM
jgi:hypothetical protein